jgi:triphosphoribosyl-dephospho-CoA synthetase
VEDTNVAARGGPEALRIVRKRAQEVLDAGGIREPEGRRLLGEMNRDFVEGNISPGGSADLLAAAIFLDSLELSFS